MELGKIKYLVERRAKDKNIDVQVVWDNFFFDEFIHRLSISERKDEFLIKGGFYLQSILGVETRSTQILTLNMFLKIFLILN